MFAPFRRAPLAGLTIAAVSKDRAFEAQCVCPKPFADRENYALVENGKPLGVS